MLVVTKALVFARERMASSAESFSEPEARSSETSKVPTSAPSRSSLNLSCSPGANCTEGAGTAAEGGGGTAASRRAKGTIMGSISKLSGRGRSRIRRAVSSCDSSRASVSARKSSGAELLRRDRLRLVVRGQHLDAGPDALAHRRVRLRVAGEAADGRSERARFVVRELRVAELLAEREVLVVLDGALDLHDAQGLDGDVAIAADAGGRP